MSIIWKSNLSNQIKCNFFPSRCCVSSTNGCTTWMLTKCIEKKLTGNCTRMLQIILNKSRKQYPTEQQLYSHQSPISKTIQIRWTRHVGHCWRSKNKLISYVLLWTPSHGHTSVRWPARTYIPQLCANTGCSLEDQPGAMDDRDEWQEREKSMLAEQHHDDIYIYIYMCVCVCVCVCACVWVCVCNIWTLFYIVSK